MPSSVLWTALGLAGIAITTELRAVRHANWDVAWLLEIAGRVLDGAVPYRDFVESNPPASVFMYVPAVFAGRLTGVSPESMTCILVFVAAALSMALCGSMVSGTKLIERSRAPVLICIGVVVLLILPLYSFGQREHIAVLAILPSLAALAARTAGYRPSLAGFVLAGFGAGIAVSIKPVFALALLGPAIFLARRRSWRIALGAPEIWIAFAVVSVYALSVALLFPEFGNRILPLVVRIYAPVRLSLLVLLLWPTFCIWLALLYTFLWWRRRDDIVATTLILASAGFQAAFLIQGKGFFYQGYPAVALAMLGCGQAMLQAPRAGSGSRSSSSVHLAPALLAFGVSFIVFAEPYEIGKIDPGLRSAIATVSPQPRLLTIGSDMALGCVFASEVGGTWVGSEPIAWITLYASAIEPHAEEDPRFAAAIRMERELYAEDIERRRPDVVLIDGSGWWRWTRRSPALVRALSRYQRVGQYGDVTLWSREPFPEAGSPAPPTFPQLTERPAPVPASAGDAVP